MTFIPIKQWYILLLCVTINQKISSVKAQQVIESQIFNKIIQIEKIQLKVIRYVNKKHKKHMHLTDFDLKTINTLCTQLTKKQNKLMKYINSAITLKNLPNNSISLRNIKDWKSETIFAAEKLTNKK